MKGALRSWRWVVAASAALAVVVLVAVTWIALGLERDQLAARAESERQSRLRLALWRLDSYVAPILAREAARPWYHYRSFVPQERAFTRLLHAIEPGEVLAPSPLLGYRSELIPLHFEFGHDGTWTSPQVPEGNQLDLAQANLSDPGFVTEARARLEALAASVDPARLRATAGAAEEDRVAAAGEAAAPPAAASRQQAELDYGSRAANQWRSAPQVQTLAGDPTLEVRVGALLPLWLDAGGDDRLAYVRRVRTGTGDRLQGFLVAWPILRERLASEVGELVPGAVLEPQRGAASDAALATLPARLALPEPEPVAAGWTPTRTALLALWLSGALAFGAFAFALRSSIALGERRARFASAVTHELRTPLTTFRMYSEMLAEGMVPAERAPEYLETLRSESDRLAGLVENVLAYARLEEGRTPLRRERVGLADLLEGARPELERRVRECGGELEVTVEDDAAAAETDPEAVRQILFNLVDNACKYGAPPVRLRAGAADGHVELHVEDAGDGVPPERARAVFRPFDRGGRDEADDTAGVGLGLALARGLARDLGGELELEPGRGPGARFRLRLPRAE